MLNFLESKYHLMVILDFISFSFENRLLHVYFCVKSVTFEEICNNNEKWHENKKIPKMGLGKTIREMHAKENPQGIAKSLGGFNLYG